MTDQAYIAAYQKLSGQYEDNQSSMGDYLAAVEKLKAQYVAGRADVVPPIVP
jgi:hypothetical protein